MPSSACGRKENRGVIVRIKYQDTPISRFLNPEKRNVMVVKNEMRFFYQKRNVLQI